MSEFNEADVRSLWRCARAHNSSIPDEALDAIRDTLLAALRQQGGMVDECYACEGRPGHGNSPCVVCGKQAALAQNTQGAGCCCGDPEASGVHHRTDGPCYHAERARVPDEMTTPAMGHNPHGKPGPAEFGYMNGWNACRHFMLAAAAAPFQPKDAQS